MSRHAPWSANTVVHLARPGRKGYTEEPFDFYRVRGTDGSAALCHQCQKGAAENKALLPCSACSLHWHLDCMSPPMACPPLPRNFRCPLHADDTPRGLMEKLAPAHKFRKVKGAPLIEQSYGRGLTNHGWIEIEEDSDEDDEAYHQHKNFGRVYRVPEKGVKLDFIAKYAPPQPQRAIMSWGHANPTPSRVKRGRQHALHDEVHTSNPAPAATTPPRVLSLQEQQAALNLTQLAQGHNPGVSQLVQALIVSGPSSFLLFVYVSLPLWLTCIPYRPKQTPPWCH